MTWLTKNFIAPISNVWRGDSDAVLQSFEPENPSLFIPRKFGVGWDLNLGAVAVKAGWIRPDDSLPDLSEHVPPLLRRALRIAPVVGGVAVLASALAVARQDFVVRKVSFTGVPKKFSSGKRAVMIPLAVTAISSLLPYVLRRSGRSPESQPAVSIVTQAEQCGIQAMVLAGLGGAYRSAKNPSERQLLMAVAPFLWLSLTGGLQILCVKTALNNIDRHLRETKKEVKN